MKAFANRGTPLVPGLRRDIVEQALALPYEAKAGRTFYRELLKKVHPRAFAAPILSGGSPMPRHRLDLVALAVLVPELLGFLDLALCEVLRVEGREPLAVAVVDR